MSLGDGGFLCAGPTEPIIEPDLPETRTVAWHERALGDGGPEVARVRVGNHLAMIAGGCEHPSNDVIEPELLRAADLHGPVHGRADGNSGHPRGNVVGRNRLEPDRRDADDSSRRSRRRRWMR